MSSDVGSEAPSDTALMVFATLANPSKIDSAVVKEKNESTLPRIEEDRRSTGSRDSNRSRRSDRSGSEHSKRSQKSKSEQSSDDEDRHRHGSYDRRERYRSDDEDSEDVDTDNMFNPPNITRTEYPEQILREAEETTRDIESETLEKQSLLLDLQRLKLQGIKLSKDWNINDKLEDMTLEIRRHTLHMDEMANVQTMRDGLRFVCTGIEMLNNRIGLLDLEGWSSEVCKDLGKHDANLSRIYRKYWRRTGTSSPELDITASLVASMGMYHFKQKMSKKIYDNRGPRKTSVPSRSQQIEEESEDDDEEGLPP
jgi:hypothetical protein